MGTIEVSSVQFEFWHSITISIIFGLIIGGLSGFAQIIIEEKLYRRISILKLMMLRLITIISLLTLIIIFAHFIVTTFLGESKGLIAFAYEAGSFAIYFYILMVDLFLGFLRQVNLMLGENNLKKYFQGKFYTPREEKRIFMFLDIRSSTAIAEKLGDHQYFRFIHDFINDATEPILYTKGEIYQYIGDEIIISWKMKNGMVKKIVVVESVCGLVLVLI